MSSPQSLMLPEKAMEIFRALKEWPCDLPVASQDSACKWNYEWVIWVTIPCFRGSFVLVFALFVLFMQMP